ncbi:hypothetical protein ACL9RL_08260 [Plantibacter sp. Mn2098]|uniref:hypothetical protein n=1 Tax=Plantibacter sp. Mn2098 TaxID=3395266 RepID=UPI003BC4B87A
MTDPHEVRAHVVDLMWAWDPIGVAESRMHTWTEYHGLADQIIAAFHRGVSAETIARDIAHEVAVDWFGSTGTHDDLVRDADMLRGATAAVRRTLAYLATVDPAIVAALVQATIVSTTTNVGTATNTADQDGARPSRVDSDWLATFDQTIGRLLLNGRPVGYLAFKLDTVRTRIGGHLWWRRYSAPRPVVNMLESYGEPPHDGWWQDAVLDGDQIIWARNLVEAGTWQISPEHWSTWASAPAVESVNDENGTPLPLTLEVVMLRGEERIAAWNEHGWGTPLAG